MNLATVTCTNCRHEYPDTALFCPSCGTAKVRADGDALLGKVLGERFLVQARLGQGTSGTIYRAEHVTLRRKVAIKVLHAELARDDLAVERFRREATMVAEVDNEHIVEIHDFGRAPDGRLYLAMEMLEGETLDEVLRREGKLSVERAADILIQLGEALMEAHAVGYVHRDLRPRNIYLAVRRGKANFVKLLDFGLAKLVESDAHAASTSLGMTFGDPRYMSPEQAKGDRIDRRADIYQLGCVAYEMLTGAPPFTGARVFDVLSRQVTEAPAPLPSRCPGVPLWMEAAVARMLAKNPDDRFATTSRLVEALRRGLERGEVMEDSVARQLEPVPPASVSRVMEKLGVTEHGVGRPELPALASAPSSGSPGSVTIATSIVPPPGAWSAPGSRPSAAPAAAPAATAPTGTAAPGSATPTAQVAAVPAPTTSPELARRRTGTPRVGVPVVAPPVRAVTAQPSGARSAVQMSSPASAPSVPSALPPGVLVGPPEMPAPIAVAPQVLASATPAATPARAPAAAVPSSAASEVDARAASAPAEAPADPGVSQAWFEDDDARAGRDTRSFSSSSTDVLFYQRAQRRRLLTFGAIGIGVAALVGLAFALAGGGGERKAPAEPPAVAAPKGTPPQAVVAAPGSELPPASASATAAAPTPVPPSSAPSPSPSSSSSPPSSSPSSSVSTTSAGRPAPSRPSSTSRTERREAAPRTPMVATPDPGGADPLLRRPAKPVVDARPPIIEPVESVDPAGGSGANGGVSGGEGTLDPYGAAGEAVAAPIKQAEELATQGQQSMQSGDLAGAAASFKKATELNPANLIAVAGLGEIALQQGLFGDAIAHLKKASKLAPRSARIQTLLGEALLNSGNHEAAAQAFKRALQINPDSSRARDGYNEASAHASSDDSPADP